MVCQIYRIWQQCPGDIEIMWLKLSTSKFVCTNMVNLAVFFECQHLSNMPTITGVKKDNPTPIKFFGWFFTCGSEMKLFGNWLRHTGSRNDKAPHDGEALSSSTIKAMATISDLHEI
ncbi:hypothetical protein CKO_01878 [Citrobacter koseri ATCC BAA-895]|uniref:Uncharacterized protein n=1 Tax=Citrobacter koseri (strain ATCC BAA-895 / CDC 4225-83 / SGSC4696) TaxID=290338 RepID=A8AHP3_CITK8|nr:hypothetical protein CKO_01878 [Citrobacter koseri ATCC BAA-895]